MAIYRFKVAFEEDDEVYRLVEIKSSQTFKQFSDAIQKAIGFDNIKPAKFNISNDNWRKGKEIAGDLLTTSKMASAIDDPHQKLLYDYDNATWTFQIELVKIIVAEPPNEVFPRIEKSVGIAPMQYKKNTIVLPQEEDEDFEDEEDPEDDNKAYTHVEGIDDEDELEGEEGEVDEAEDHEEEEGEHGEHEDHQLDADE